MQNRIFDVIGSLVLLGLFAPLMLVIAIAVRIMTGKPIFFKQKRLGHKEVPFNMYKFRSMANGSDNGISVTSEMDKRITSIGRYLRKTHFDELPQLWNILRGEMSLVGPRPICPNAGVTILMRDYPNFKDRFKVRPGLTGQTQIRGRRWVMDNVNQIIPLEVQYVYQRSFLLDLKILLTTIFVILKGKGV